MQLQIFLLLPLFYFGSAFAADLLQNPDFESPPSNLPQNSTTPFLLLNENNTIPGWSFQGTVQYVTADKNISLPGNGHAIQLGQDGKINQTFKANADYMSYLLTFTLAPDGQNCSSYASIDVSAPDSHTMFSLKQQYGREAWESYGVYLGNWVQDESINLVIGSQTTDSIDNSTCWPLIDKLLLKTIGTLGPGKDNLLQNGGFEFGPEFLSNSTEGILLDTEPSPVRSALTQWSVIGTIKYIDSKHYFVPEGEAAIEIVSGISTGGIQTAITLTEGSEYSLEFTLGDANDSCEGNFVVGVQAGSTLQNFTVQSNGSGSARKFSLPFKASSTTNSISFISYTASQTKDHLLCGPVVDNVILRAASHGMKLQMQWKVLISMLFLLPVL